MSAFSPENRGIPSLGAGTIPSLGARSTDQIPTIGGGVSLDAPRLLPRNLTRPTTFDPSQTGSLSLMDQAIGRASLILDQVRARRLTWEDARDVLKTLSEEDKKTLARFRPDMSEDEKRALDLPRGGGLLSHLGDIAGEALMMGPNIVSHVLGRDNPVGRVAGNLVTDTSESVRALPAGLIKTGMTLGSDVGEIVGDPARGITLPHTREEILGPIAHQYGFTYGPALHGDFGKTGSRIMDHPLAPLLDAFAIASAGIGTVARGAAVSRAIAASRVVEESPTQLRMGVVDRTTEQYAPLGYSKEFYVRPNRTEMRNEPQKGFFSVLIDAKTGESIFSPMGSSHDEIYDPLFEKRGTADRNRWDNPEKHPIIQGTGIFDPKTGKPQININPDDVPSPYLDNVPNIIDKVKAQAEETYLTAKQYKDIQRTNRAGTIIIRQGRAQKRYDPHTGEKLPPLWYIMRPNGQRIASNLPSKEAAIAHAQSLVTGGILPDVLEQSWRPFYQPAPRERAVERALKADLTEESLPSGDYNQLTRVLGETQDWPRQTKFERAGLGSSDMDPVDFAEEITMIAHEMGEELFSYRTPEGKLAGIAEYKVYDDVPLGGQPFVKVGGIAAGVQGAAAGIVGEIARKFPGREIHFSPATPGLADYYESIGASFLHETGAGVMKISAEDAAKLASGKAIRAGTTSQERVYGEGLTPRSKFSIGREAFMQRPRGSLIDAYNTAAGRSHAKEFEGIISEVILNVLDNPDIRLKRRGIREALQQTFAEMGEDIATSLGKDVGRFKGRMESQPQFMSPALSAALSTAGISVREVSDLVRAGAVFLRPAYIPNNWAGNGFLNTIQQGVYAPINLAKALVIDKHLGTLYARGIDQSMGFNASEVLAGGRGAGYIASATDPVAKLMGSIADQPFRRAAWIHEARRAGYKSLGDVKRLWDKANAEKKKFVGKDPDEWDMSTTPALAEIAKISRAAQEEIIKFGKYNDIERGILRNLIFVYSWMRGAGRYFGRFPLQHPIQAAAMASLSGVGQNWLNQELGGVPAFLIGAIPVGKDEKGNHMLINPFSINPLSTGQEVLASAASLKNIITDPRNFNKYVNQDPSALLNPLVQDALEAWSGGRPLTESVPDSIAALRLKENLEHPGRGQIYPTSRQEALGQYFLGSMFPRQSSQAAITRSLQRERADQPEQRIDDEVAAFKQQTGADMPPEFVELYRKDLQALDKQKEFQHSYAKKHGSQGFSNMPAANRADAAIEYLAKNSLIAPQDLARMEDMVKQAHSDYELNLIANSLWRITGAGSVKDQWDQLIHGSSSQSQLTPLRP
jgi:hypothetical protein